MAAFLVRAYKHGVSRPLPDEYARREQLMLEEGVVILPFHEIPDLSDISDDEDRLKKRFALTYHWEPKRNATDYWMWQTWHFIHQMVINDLVVLTFYPYGDKAAVGEVTGGYEYRADLGGLHARSVKWLCKDLPVGGFAEIVQESLKQAVMDFCRIAGEAPLEQRAQVDPHIREMVARRMAQDETGG